ncbi:MAG TPA: GDP-mannose 4,6-dehydratase [Chitinophagaceae bacterium]
MKTAIISGVTGQDGAYLAKLLVDKGYKVYGLIRSFTGTNTYRLDYLGIIDRIELLECDLQDLSQVIKIISSARPDEFYNLAAQSSVSLSFQQPIGTIQFNINSVVNVLESIRLLNPSIRFYQASSSEMFGKIEELPITEESKLHPLSPYAISKVAGHHITIHYRESYGLFSCCGILFNHESYLRGNNFIIKKILVGALDILAGKKEFIEFGNLDVKRDFGYSRKYVEAMWLILQQEKADDFVICSGQSVSLRNIVHYVFNKLNVPLSAVRVNKAFFRPNDIEDIYGSSEKAKRLLGWDYNMNFFQVLDILIEEERKNYGG